MILKYSNGEKIGWNERILIGKTSWFSLETGKHYHYSYVHVAYLYIQCQKQYKSFTFIGIF